MLTLCNIKVSVYICTHWNLCVYCSNLSMIMLHIALWRSEEKIGDEVSFLKTISNLFLWRFFPYERLWFDNSQEYIPNNSDIMLKGKQWFPHVSLQRQTSFWSYKAFYSILFFLCFIRSYPETRNICFVCFYFNMHYGTCHFQVSSLLHLSCHPIQSFRLDFPLVW